MLEVRTPLILCPPPPWKVGSRVRPPAAGNTATRRDSGVDLVANVVAQGNPALEGRSVHCFSTVNVVFALSDQDVFQSKGAAWKPLHCRQIHVIFLMHFARLIVCILTAWLKTSQGSKVSVVCVSFHLHVMVVPCFSLSLSCFSPSSTSSLPHSACSLPGTVRCVAFRCSLCCVAWLGLPLVLARRERPKGSSALETQIKRPWLAKSKPRRRLEHVGPRTKGLFTAGLVLTTWSEEEPHWQSAWQDKTWSIAIDRHSSLVKRQKSQSSATRQ